jgi:hypothetical protein
MILPVAFGVGLRSSISLELLPQLRVNGRVISFTHTRMRQLPVADAQPDNSYPAQGRTMQVRLLQHKVHADKVHVTIVDLLQFELDFSVDHIECIATEDASDDLVRYWFLQQMLPMFLLLNGSTELLHATAVRTDSGGVALLGCSGIGKSTLLDYCLSQGGSLITDEHLAFDRSAYTMAVPSLPFYRPYRNAEDLGIRAARFETQPSELRRIYVLKPADASAAVSTEPLTHPELIASLINNRQYNVFNPDRPGFFPLVKKRFAGLASLVRDVPVKRLNVPRAFHRLPEVYQFMQQDLAS